jgi:NADPH-dependent 2,4-dienoyl-CoA reductase/sulfur reductase-like enzyme/nitrite reductase/ring-hydroxylating ferredoxin subunit
VAKEEEAMGEAAAISGPDFSLGIRQSEVPAGGVLAGHVEDEPVLLSRLGGELRAVGGACTHYGAALADGLVDGETVRCPLHHACFSLRTGAALSAPAFAGLDAWEVELEGEQVFVRRKLAPEAPAPASPPADDVRSVVIVGGGAAGFACAHELRRLGFEGGITMLSADSDPPCDRPNLSKDYLAGSAQPDWIPLRDGSWYSESGIDLRLGTRIVGIDPAGRRVRAASGEEFSFDRLLLATGSEPNRLDLPGFERDTVFTLRSVADSDAIAARAASGSRAVVIGSSFIGLEAAAALVARGVGVHVVSPERVPFERQFGAEVGGFFRALHERHGVRFHLGTEPAAFDGRSMRLANNQSIDADFVLVGVGVRPRLDLGRSAGVAVDKGLCVDPFLETDVPGIFAAGDIAAYPDPAGEGRLRIEHWVVALRQGQAAAANMLGLGKRFESVPFFWTEQYGVALRYTGHAARWDRVEIEGDVATGDFIARYHDQGVHRASASVGRDFDNLEDERRLEKAGTSKAAPASNPQS